MAVFGFVVLCILAALFAIVLAAMFITGSIYLISYIHCDFSERQCRWKAESRDRQLYKYIQNLIKYKSNESSVEDKIESDERKDSEEVSEDAEEKEDSDFDDVIDSALNK